MSTNTKQQGVAELSAQGPGAYAWYALGLLTLVYVLNFLDRTLIYILFTPIKKEMAFSDFQLALLGTTSFVIFYTGLGIPLAGFPIVVRKNTDRGGLAIWSIFSGLTWVRPIASGRFSSPRDGWCLAKLRWPRCAVIAELFISPRGARLCKRSILQA